MRNIGFASSIVLIAFVAGCVVRTVNNPPPEGPTYQAAPPPPPSGTAVTQGAPPPRAQPAAPAPVPPGGLRGNLRMQAACTRMACAQSNPCCNTCNLTVLVMPTEGDFVGREIKLGGHSCRVDGCGKVSACDLVDGALYTFPKVDVKCSGTECFGTLQ